MTEISGVTEIPEATTDILVLDSLPGSAGISRKDGALTAIGSSLKHFVDGIG
jgi:hypothetical protein